MRVGRRDCAQRAVAARPDLPGIGSRSARPALKPRRPLLAERQPGGWLPGAIPRRQQRLCEHTAATLSIGLSARTPAVAWATPKERHWVELARMVGSRLRAELASSLS